MRLDARKTLLLIVAVCILPIAASYLTFYVIKPAGRLNYGELLPTKPLPELFFGTARGENASLAQFKGKWVMLQIAGSACNAHCRTKLYYMRQVRTAQGKDMERIERVWFLTDSGMPDTELLREYDGTHVLRLRSADAPAMFPADGDVTAHIYVIDPLGNLMMRYPEDPDPRRIIKDFGRLLKVSRIG